MVGQSYDYENCAVADGSVEHVICLGLGLIPGPAPLFLATLRFRGYKRYVVCEHDSKVRSGWIWAGQGIVYCSAKFRAEASRWQDAGWIMHGAMVLFWTAR